MTPTCQKCEGELDFIPAEKQTRETPGWSAAYICVDEDCSEYMEPIDPDEFIDWDLQAKEMQEF